MTHKSSLNPWQKIAKIIGWNEPSSLCSHDSCAWSNKLLNIVFENLIKQKNRIYAFAQPPSQKLKTRSQWRKSQRVIDGSAATAKFHAFLNNVLLKRVFYKRIELYSGQEQGPWQQQQQHTHIHTQMWRVKSKAKAMARATRGSGCAPATVSGGL